MRSPHFRLLFLDSLPFFFPPFDTYTDTNFDTWHWHLTGAWHSNPGMWTMWTMGMGIGEMWFGGLRVSWSQRWWGFWRVFGYSEMRVDEPRGWIFGFFGCGGRLDGSRLASSRTQKDRYFILPWKKKGERCAGGYGGYRREVVKWSEVWNHNGKWGEVRLGVDFTLSLPWFSLKAVSNLKLNIHFQSPISGRSKRKGTFKS